MSILVATRGRGTWEAMAATFISEKSANFLGKSAPFLKNQKVFLELNSFAGKKMPFF